MKIQQQNSYNPNMKALYFTTTAPMRSEIMNYKNQKITEAGIKYVEDTSAKLTPIMKEAFEENPFIQRFVKKCDVFVQYFGEKFEGWSLPGMFCSRAMVYIVPSEISNTTVDSYNFAGEDKYTPEGARLRLIDRLEHGRYGKSRTYKLDE